MYTIAKESQSYHSANVGCSVSLLGVIFAAFALDFCGSFCWNGMLEFNDDGVMIERYSRAAD